MLFPVSKDFPTGHLGQRHHEGSARESVMFVGVEGFGYGVEIDNAVRYPSRKQGPLTSKSKPGGR